MSINAKVCVYVYKVSVHGLRNGKGGFIFIHVCSRCITCVESNEAEHQYMGEEITRHVYYMCITCVLHVYYMCIGAMCIRAMCNEG